MLLLRLIIKIESDSCLNADPSLQLCCWASWPISRGTMRQVFSQKDCWITPLEQLRCAIRRHRISISAPTETVGCNRALLLQRGFADHSSSGNTGKLGQSQPEQKYYLKCVCCRIFVVTAPAEAAGKTASHQKQIEHCLSVEFVHTNPHAYILNRAVFGLNSALPMLSSNTA